LTFNIKSVKINITDVNLTSTFLLKMKGGIRLTEERREKIRVLFSEKPYVSLAELCEMFPDLSDMTLRRDIEYFDRIGVAVKVRGGARSVKFIGDTTEAPIDNRMSTSVEEKTRIAKAASAFLENGHSVFLDSGSTVEKIVDFAPQTKMSFITTSPSIALALCRRGPHSVNIVGGRIDRDSLSVSGMHAMRYVNDVNLDIAFLSPSGFSASGGFTCGNYGECELKALVVEKARFVVMLMDKTKIDRVLPFTFCNLEDVDVLVTDEPLPEELARAVSEAGTKVICAQNEL